MLDGKRMLLAAFSCSFLVTACSENSGDQSSYVKKSENESLVDVSVVLDDAPSIDHNATGEVVPLPAWQTREEKMREALMPVPYNLETSSPPSGDVYVPAEYALMEGVIVRASTYSSMYPFFGRMIRAIADSGATPYILVSSSQEASAVTQNVLQPYGTSSSEVEFVGTDNDAFWSRDFGPWHVYVNGRRAIVDQKYYSTRPNDDRVPKDLGDAWDEDVYSTYLYTEGGNFMTDGLGTCWASTGVLEYNTHLSRAQIERVYTDYVGCDHIYFVEPLYGEGTTHVDMFSKVLDQDTILVGYSSASLGASVYEISALDNAASFYANTPKPSGGQWNIIRIPMTFHYSGNQRVYNAHTNSLIVNKHVIVPTYGRGTDAAALQIYRDAMPGYTVVGVDARSIIPSGGSVHCTTMQVPARTLASCGNGVITGGEQCDMTLGGATCSDLGYQGGTLTCTSTCRFDTSLCDNVSDGYCGDGVVGGGEICDGEAVACTALSGEYAAGMASCNSSCSGYDTSACTTAQGGKLPFSTSATVTKGNWKHYGPFDIAEGILSAVLAGTGDGDLYVRRGAQPTLTAYDCRPYQDGSGETCQLDGPGTFYVSVNGYATSSSFSLKVDFAPKGDDDDDEVVTETKTGTVLKDKYEHYQFVSKDGLLAKMTGTGDADLYVWQNVESPTWSNYTCRPYKEGSSESCDLSGSGDFLVIVRGYAASSTYTLDVTYAP